MFLRNLAAVTSRKRGPKGLAPNGAAIRRRREELGLTVQELAARADVGDKHLYGLETGNNKARVERFQRIADALGVPLAFVVVDARRPAADPASAGAA